METESRPQRVRCNSDMPETREVDPCVTISCTLSCSLNFGARWGSPIEIRLSFRLGEVGPWSYCDEGCVVKSVRNLKQL
jgi:hypothetical protein